MQTSLKVGGFFSVQEREIQTFQGGKCVKHLRETVTPLLFFAFFAALIFTVFAYGANDPLGSVITKQMIANKK